jgi:hypothetical protein
MAGSKAGSILSARNCDQANPKKTLNLYLVAVKS